MRRHVALRKLHAWGALLAALPLVVIAVTGILLQLKKQIAWVQPPEVRGAPGDPRISAGRILEAAREAPGAGVATWADIARIDIRPDRGLVKVTTATAMEVQIDAGDGRVLQVARRRSDWIEALHDGSGFHDAAKWALFLPSGFVLVGLWLTGLYLFFLPIAVRRRVRRARAAGPAGAG